MIFHEKLLSREKVIYSCKPSFSDWFQHLIERKKGKVHAVIEVSVYHHFNAKPVILTLRDSTSFCCCCFERHKGVIVFILTTLFSLGSTLMGEPLEFLCDHIAVQNLLQKQLCCLRSPLRTLFFMHVQYVQLYVRVSS